MSESIIDGIYKKKYESLKVNNKKMREIVTDRNLEIFNIDVENTKLRKENARLVTLLENTEDVF